jgi:diacylglycerol kinase family enzyme
MEMAGNLSRKGKTAVVAAGGDGTCNEVINGLLDTSGEGNPPLVGILPVGRGNDFAYGAGISSELYGAMSALLSENITLLDAGRVFGGEYPQGRWFGNGIGIGFDAIVGFEAEGMTGIHGSAAYILAALKTLVKYPAAPEVDFTADGVSSRVNPALISIMNGKRMGGSFFMAPDADSRDGMLNFCRTEQGSRLRLLSALVTYMKGTQARRSDTSTGMASEYTVKALKGGLAVHADGERICRSGTELRVEILKGALRLLGSNRD